MPEITIDEALQQGVEAHKAGRVQDADRLYTAILKALPKHPDANHNMGVLAVGVGKVALALPFFKTALETNPAKVQFWLSYIDALIKLDRLADAKASLDQAKNKGANGDGFDKLEKRLQEADGEYYLDNTRTETSGANQSSTLDTAIELRETGEINQAIDLLEDAINKSPGDVNILALLSHCYLLEGHLDGAKLLLGKAQKVAPNNARVGWNIARLKLQEQNPLEALNVARDTSRKFPDDVEGMAVLGTCLRANGEFSESLNVLNRAIELNPNCAEALVSRGLIKLSQENKTGALADLQSAHRLKPHIKQIWNFVIGLSCEAKQYSDAILLLTNMIEIDPNWEPGISLLSSIHLNLGIELKKQGEFKKALVNFKRALEHKSDNAEALNSMGNALSELGKLKKAIEAYKKALAIKPDYSIAHRNLSMLTRYSPDEEQIRVVDGLLLSPNLSDTDRCNLHYTSAKMKEDLGDMSASFDNLVVGGALKKKLLAYDFSQDQNLFMKIKNTAPQFKDITVNLSIEAIKHLPIFIVGMPRSGTTLIEQIVSSHTQVTGAGELNYVNQFGYNLAVGQALINAGTVQSFREHYLAALTKKADGRPFVTDKMPHNFRFMALICTAFPEAKVIHVQRNAKATCWSNFKQYFASNELGYSYSLRDTVRYYGLYKDLMQLWYRNYNKRIYNLNYDKLTEDQGLEIERLIEYLGLEWEDGCLAPQNNKKPVRTASKQQVRQKIYTGSSHAWKNYEPFLGGAFKSLKDLSAL